MPGLMTLDLATCMGFTIGPGKHGCDASLIRADTFALLRKDETAKSDADRGFRRLGIWLRDQFEMEIPALVVVEAPISVGGMIRHEKDEEGRDKTVFKSNPSTIYFLGGLVACVHAICGPYAIRCRQVNVQTVRKHFVGRARPPDPKREVLARCHMLKYMNDTQWDNNVADAFALRDYAISKLWREDQEIVAG